MKLPKFLTLKIYQNKNNKQRIIVLPANKIKSFGKKLPKNDRVKVSW